MDIKVWVDRGPASLKIVKNELESTRSPNCPRRLVATPLDGGGTQNKGSDFRWEQRPGAPFLVMRASTKLAIMAMSDPLIEWLSVATDRAGFCAAARSLPRLVPMDTYESDLVETILQS